MPLRPPIASKADIEQLEKVINQLEALHNEIAQLARKSPNDGLNTFKLRLVNKTLAAANALLLARYKPFDDFDQFEADELPSNSDVTMIIAQYMKQAERFRSDNVTNDNHGRWFYRINGALSDVPSKAPTRVGADRK